MSRRRRSLGAALARLALSGATPLARLALSGAAALAILALSTSTALADPLPLRIDYQAHEGCPTKDMFLEQVTSRTHRARAAATSDEPALEVWVRITRSEPRSMGRLVLWKATGARAREVDSHDCRDVVSALALITALALDPNAATSARAPTPAATPATSPPAGTSALPTPTGASSTPGGGPVSGGKAPDGTGGTPAPPPGTQPFTPLPPSGLPPPGLAPSGLAPSGLPPSGLAPSGMPPTGLPLSGQASSGLAPFGQPFSGQPLSGQPLSTLPLSGQAPSGPWRGGPRAGSPGPERWLGGAQVAAMIGVAPRALFAGGLFLERRWGEARGVSARLAVEVGGTGSFDVGPGGVSFLQGNVRLEGCPFLRPARWLGVGACLSGEGGFLLGQGILRGSLTTVEQALVPWGAVGVLPRVTVDVGRSVVLSLDGGPMFPLVRRAFVFENPSFTIHEVPAVTGEVRVGAGVRF